MRYQPTLTDRLYLLLAPLLLVAVVVGAVTVANWKDDTAELSSALSVKELAVKSMALLLTQDDASKTMMLDPDNPSAGAHKIQAYDQNNAVLGKMAALGKGTRIEQIVQQLHDLDEKELRSLDTEMLEAIGEGKDDAAKKIYFTRYEPVRARYQKLVTALQDAATEEADQRTKKISARRRASFQTICISLGAGIALIGLFMTLTARKIGRTLSSTATQLAEEARETEQSSHNIRQSNSEISEATSQIASAIGSSSAELEVVVRTSESCAGDAHKAAESARSTAISAETVEVSVSEMNRVMTDIRNSSESVSKIIHVIKEIAFQTNLLSLNAAIEAAHAGKHGLGFTVVAEEVRNLSRRCAAAATDTEELIAASVERSRAALEITATVTSRMLNVVDEVRNLTKFSERMSAASREQSLGAQRVFEAMRDISSNTDAAANHAAQGVSAADRLEHSATDLRTSTDLLLGLVVRKPRQKVTA